MFQEIDFLEPIRAFLMSYPALKPWERLEIDYMKVDPTTPPGFGNAVAFAGMNRPQREQYIDGGATLTEQANLTLVIRRYTNDNELLRDIGDFMFNYIRWVNYENEMRGTAHENPLLPRFSQTEHERILASGGMGMGETADPNVDEYLVQIQLEFQTYYQNVY